MSKMRTDIGIAWVHQGARSAMIAESNEVFPKETGGILVGYWVSCDVVVVTDVIGPGPRAAHEIDRFVPDPGYQNEKLASRYLESGRLYSYLGDWHSHPNAGPQLSRMDRKALRTIAGTPQARAPIPLMAILANGNPWSLTVWRCLPRRTDQFVVSVQLESLAVRIYSDSPMSGKNSTRKSEMAG